MGCMRWLGACSTVVWIATACQRLEVQGPGESIGVDGSSSSDGTGSESSESDTTAAASSGGGEVGSGIPGCDGNPPSDPRFQEDGSHSNCNGEECGCDEVCVRPHLVCSCNDDGCEYRAPPVGCRAIPPQCIGLRDRDAVDCMLPVLCEEEDTWDGTSYYSGELTCSPPYGDCW
jgi:hypothetical protein